MSKAQTIADFYAEKLSWVPDDLHKGIGHFNVFRFEDFAQKRSGLTLFSRKDYYKISLLRGRRRLYYADKVLETGSQALLFSNPQAPYQWEAIAEEPGGCCCVFTPAFFQQFGNWQAYPVFQAEATPVFELTPAQADQIQLLYDRMLAELDSTYAYKYDALRTLVFELVHTALKMQPAPNPSPVDSNAARRLATRFLELLERQFPIENPGHRLQMRTAADYANLLAVHSNHLNKALQAAVGHTTTDLIAERVLREAKILLKGTTWNVAEIADALGFKEATHFNNFFRKHVGSTPKAFRLD